MNKCESFKVQVEGSSVFDYDKNSTRKGYPNEVRTEVKETEDESIMIVDNTEQSALLAQCVLHSLRRN